MTRVAFGLLLFLLLGAPAEASRTFTVQPHGKPKGTVLVIHGGAWVWGDSMTVNAPAHGYARAGYRAVAVDYPLHNMPAAFRAVDRVARKYHYRASAIGFSAGGTMAAWLAARNHVRAAVDLSGPTRLGGGLTPAQSYGLWRTTDAGRWAPSRALDGRDSLRVITGALDPYVTAGERGALRAMGIRVRTVPGLSHEAPPSQWARALRALKREL